MWHECFICGKHSRPAQAFITQNESHFVVLVLVQVAALQSCRISCTRDTKVQLNLRAIQCNLDVISTKYGYPLFCNFRDDENAKGCFLHWDVCVCLALSVVVIWFLLLQKIADRPSQAPKRSLHSGRYHLELDHTNWSYVIARLISQSIFRADD